MPACNGFLTEVAEICFNCVLSGGKKFNINMEQFPCIRSPSYTRELFYTNIALRHVGHALMFSDCIFLIQRATANETEQVKIERKMVEITTNSRASVPLRLIILYFVDS